MSLLDHVAFDDLRPLVRLRRLSIHALFEVRLAWTGGERSRQQTVWCHLGDRIDAAVSGGITR